MGSSLFKPFVLTSKMSEEVELKVFNVEPYQYEPMATKSDPGTSDDSSDSNEYDVNKDRISKVDWWAFVHSIFCKKVAIEL